VPLILYIDWCVSVETKANFWLIIEREFDLEKDIFEMFGKIMHIAEPTPPPNGITLTPEVIERLKSALY